MQTLVHADIFFFISSIALVVLSILVAVGLYYTLGILRDVREISRRVNKASVDLEKDLDALRNTVKAEGNKVRGIADFVIGFVGRSLAPKAVRRKKVAEVEVELEEEE